MNGQAQTEISPPRVYRRAGLHSRRRARLGCVTPGQKPDCALVSIAFLGAAFFAAPALRTPFPQPRATSDK